MTITKNKGKFYCRFQIDGERHHYLCAGATTVKEAERMEAAFKYKVQQAQNGVIARDEAPIKFKQLIELYLEYSRINNKGFKNNKYYTKAFIDYFGENSIVQKIGVRNIEHYRDFLRTERKLKNSTINRQMHVLSKIFNLGCVNKLIKSNPVSEVRQLREENHKIRFLTSDEELRLFEALKDNDTHLYPIVVCALQTGMRRGEILNLKWNNIDFEQGFIELLETKSGKARKIPISDKLRQVLTKQRQAREYVFTNPQTGKAYTDIKHSFTTLLKRAEIEHFRFHDLRHTVATRLVEKGIDLVVVKEILGHSNIETTMRYAHAVPKRKLEAIEVLNSYV